MIADRFGDLLMTLWLTSSFCILSVGQCCAVIIITILSTILFHYHERRINESQSREGVDKSSGEGC